MEFGEILVIERGRADGHVECGGGVVFSKGEANGTPCRQTGLRCIEFGMLDGVNNSSCEARE